MNQMLSMLFGKNPLLNDLAQNAGLVDLVMQGYQAYKNGKLPDFLQYQYDNNIQFRKFYDKNKGKSFEEFLKEKNIHLQ